MPTETLAMKITKMVFEEEPNLLACTPDATARAAASVANVLGAVLATVLVQKGEATYRACLKEMVGKIHDSAIATAKVALADINDSTLTTKQ